MEKTVLVNFVRKFEEGDSAACDAYRTGWVHNSTFTLDEEHTSKYVGFSG